MNKDGQASPVKIAYFIQRMYEKDMKTKEILLVIFSSFDEKELKEFARLYKCHYKEDISKIANLINNIPYRKIVDFLNKI